MTHIDSNDRLTSLRARMESAGLDVFLVPMADEYQSEYVPDCARRVAFLSGFTGSAGFIVVTRDRAAFFTDSRYTLQASQQVSSQSFVLFDSAQKTPYVWMEEALAKGARVGFDPWLHCAASVERLKKALAKVEAVAVPTDENLVDAIWTERPLPPAAPFQTHSLSYAGKPSEDKRTLIAADLKKRNLAAAIITDPASVAWLLNIRGGDVPNTPLPLSRAIIYDDARVQLFADAIKIKDGMAAHLGPQVSIFEPSRLADALDTLARTGRPILLDPEHAASWIVDCLRAAGGKIEHGDDPCELPRACKNTAEVEGMRAAHRRDGAALAKFLAWLERSWPNGDVTELSAEEKLAAFRAAGHLYRGPSFDTIAGVGEHGAIVHYRATPHSDVKLRTGTLFLLDSGGQYLDGTTDVTRTVALGAPTMEMRQNFTRVLKGHIALASVRFPEGTTGADLDVLARRFLWDAGLDFGHGTGHGVGCYLGVHEGPQAISRRNKTALQPGMILSNEPGYYKNGSYGIRIENLMVVVEQLGIGAGERRYLGFESLTLAPIDRDLIDVSMLSLDEIEWLDAYHLRVWQVLRSMVDEATASWLEAATAPIGG